MVRQIKVMATELSWLEHNTHNVGVASSNLAVATKFAGLAKLVDAPDLGSGAERCVGSSPSSRTIYRFVSQIVVGVSPSGKAPGFDLGIPRFES